MKVLHLPFIFIPIAIVSGCVMVTPSIFYPRTSVRGLVLDQDGKTVPDVQIEVYKEVPMSLLMYRTPFSKWFIKSDKQGRWNVSARKVGRLFVEAMPPEGYKRSDKTRSEVVGPFGSGDCPTNDFILRLERTLIPEKGVK